MNEIEAKKATITLEYLKDLRKNLEGEKGIKAVEKVIKIIKTAECIE